MDNLNNITYCTSFLLHIVCIFTELFFYQASFILQVSSFLQVVFLRDLCTHVVINKAVDSPRFRKNFFTRVSMTESGGILVSAVAV